ncbi:MAG: glycosyltransferase 61 family protein [Parvibaculum sp.]|uniref:glycosyltransferase 61 family protein n=1 Tax=Parvibaculum sp. TaxID=2024848 RepID=UPI002721A5B5|nr:glycosyltransferase 61 family protein [Parvibaculum sp.]MDO8838311.1 glycosyltransferase 61 family protein [Parvibaculum sp.]
MRHGRVRDRFPSELPLVQSSPLKGTYLYGGPLKVHFGHVIVDSIIRLWAFDRRRHKGVVFAFFPRPVDVVPNWFFDVVSLFGVMRDDVYIIREPTIVETLEFFEPGSRLGSTPHNWYLHYLESLPIVKTSRTPKNIYFGRTHILHRGAMLGERYFGRLLEESGFQYVKPEHHDIHTQVSMIENADRIVFAEGSSIYSAELLPRTKARIFMIPRRKTGEKIFASTLRPRGSFTVLGKPDTLIDGLNRRGLNHADCPSYIRDPEALHADMVQHGLIDGRPFSDQAFREAERIDFLTYYKDIDQSYARNFSKLSGWVEYVRNLFQRKKT